MKKKDSYKALLLTELSHRIQGLTYAIKFAEKRFRSRDAEELRTCLIMLKDLEEWVRLKNS